MRSQRAATSKGQRALASLFDAITRRVGGLAAASRTFTAVLGELEIERTSNPPPFWWVGLADVAVPVRLGLRFGENDCEGSGLA